MSLWKCDKCGAISGFNFAVCISCGGQARLFNATIQHQVIVTTTSSWRPIETAPRATKCLFWIVPKTADETWYDTSGNPILAKSEPHAKLTVYGSWGSLMKATHWQPLPEGPK